MGIGGNLDGSRCFENASVWFQAPWFLISYSEQAENCGFTCGPFQVELCLWQRQHGQIQNPCDHVVIGATVVVTCL